MLFIVHTQFLENYGAFEGSGKFSEGESRWKYKFGNTYVVDGLDREADAVAFVMAAFSANHVSFKEYPSHVQSYDEWCISVNEDRPEHWESTKRMAKYVRPETGKQTMSYLEIEKEEEEMTANQYEYEQAYAEMSEYYA